MVPVENESNAYSGEKSHTRMGLLLWGAILLVIFIVLFSLISTLYSESRDGAVRLYASMKNTIYQVNGSSTGQSLRDRSAKAARITRVCSSTLLGSPSGWPRGNGTNSALGGRIFSVISRNNEIETVVIPAYSMAR